VVSLGTNFIVFSRYWMLTTLYVIDRLGNLMQLLTILLGDHSRVPKATKSENRAAIRRVNASVNVDSLRTGRPKIYF
jgi:hypothetical protein